MSVNVRHFGIVVEDLDKALDFYRDLLGLTVVVEAEEDSQFIDSLLGLKQSRLTTVKLAGPGGPVQVELLKFHAPAGARRDCAVNSPGPTHCAFTVDDLDGLHGRLTAAGVQFIAPPMLSPNKKAKVAYCRDLELNFVELVEILA